MACALHFCKGCLYKRKSSAPPAPIKDVLNCYKKNMLHCLHLDPWITAGKCAPSIADAIPIAATGHLCGLTPGRACFPHVCKNSHQTRLSKPALRIFANELLTRIPRLIRVSDFDGLFHEVANAAYAVKASPAMVKAKLTGKVNAPDFLTIYDTALRLGFHPAINKYPDKIFLHAGPGESVVKLCASGIITVKPRRFPGVPNAKYYAKSDFSSITSASTLQEYEIENFLCVCENCF
jgi:hypothetical protein